MPTNVTLDQLIVGYSGAIAEAAGEMIPLVVREFTCSADGELFMSRLDGLPRRLLSLVPPDVTVGPSTVDHLLALIRPDRTATVFLNECTVTARSRLGRTVAKGDPITEDDFVEIDSLTFDGFPDDPDAAVVCVFSAGWRKGLFFDLYPIQPVAHARSYSLPRVLGSCMSLMLHHDLFTLTEEQWCHLTASRWFPFATLTRSVRRSLLAAVQNGRNPDYLLTHVIAAVTSLLPHMRSRWRSSQLLSPHLPLLEHAIAEYEAGDYLSCTAILYPRIEGILRTLHGVLGATEKASQRILSSMAVRGRGVECHEYSWLLPHRFEQYLRNVYFSSFEPHSRPFPSRNSVGHGIADAAAFDAKAASIGLLVVDQIFYLLPDESREV